MSEFVLAGDQWLSFDGLGRVAVLHASHGVLEVVCYAATRRGVAEKTGKRVDLPIGVPVPMREVHSTVKYAEFLPQAGPAVRVQVDAPQGVSVRVRRREKLLQAT